MIIESKSVHGDVSVEPDRYSFTCRGCDGNTRLDALTDLRVDLASPESPHGRVRKAGRDFFVTCEKTGRERLLYRSEE